LTIRLGSTFFDIYARFTRMWYYSSRRGVSTQSILIVTRQADAHTPATWTALIWLKAADPEQRGYDPLKSTHGTFPHVFVHIDLVREVSKWIRCVNVPRSLLSLGYFRALIPSGVLVDTINKHFILLFSSIGLQIVRKINQALICFIL
jgi:hypothetical protein